MNESPNRNTSQMAMMRGEVARVRTVRQYVNGAPRASVESATAQRPTSRPVETTFARALQWLCTMSKLDEPTDMQAAMSGARAMLEMVIDLTLINGNSRDYPPAKLVAWEGSALLKQAESVQKLDNSHDLELQTLLDSWLKKNRERVLAERELYWPTGKPGTAAKHPNRWTGHHLGTDADNADGASGSKDLLELYRRLHSVLCWNTHGSGAAGVGSISVDDFPGLNAAALHYGAQFGLNVARLSLVHFDLYDEAAEAANDAAKVEAERVYERALAEPR